MRPLELRRSQVCLQVDGIWDLAEIRGVRAPSTPQELSVKLDRLFEAAKRWAAVWGYSRLMRELDVEFSPATRSVLGRCDITRKTVTLNGVLLLDPNEALLFETLCHELAHVVTVLRYGNRVEEHGPEWSEYMEKAGFRPRAVIPKALIQFGD